MTSPRVSVVIPAYGSEVTIGRCLEAIGRQTYRDFETIVVDSSPNDATASVVRERFPSVQLVRSPRRLLPHDARNTGVTRSAGELLVFTDPDIYMCDDWLERLVRAHAATGHVIVGSFGCFGRRWLDLGFHLTKFSKWLPGSKARVVDNAPSGNFLVSRPAFARVGGFPCGTWSGDVELSRRLQAAGETLWFEPAAKGEHHHMQSFAAFYRERIERGFAFGQLRCSWYADHRFTVLALLLGTVLPIRLVRNLLFVARQAIDAGHFGAYVTAFPVIAAGYMATLAGESAAYAQSMKVNRRQVVADRG